MSDQPKSIPSIPSQPGWEEQLGFHGLFLMQFYEEEVAALKLSARTWYTNAVAAMPPGPYDPNEIVTADEMESALEDLKMLALFLTDTGLKPERNEMPVKEVRLALVAGDCALILNGVVAKIEEAVARCRA